MSQPVVSTARTELPRWLSSDAVAWIGALLALLTVALGAGFLMYEQSEIEERELQSSEMYARVLQDHADRTFNTVDIALTSLADSPVVAAGALHEPARLSLELAQALQGLPFLRSLSLIDAGGHVLASSSSDNLGVVVDLERIRLPAAGAVDRLGSLVPGRDLADAAAGQAPPAAGSTPRSFVPLVRAGVAGAPGVFLVATLNPEFFANAYELTLADPTRTAALFSVDRVMLAATDNIRLQPGQPAGKHRFFDEYLPAHESGRFVGPGIDGAPVVTAFRMLRKRPVAVFVERQHDSLSTELGRTAGWVGGACGLALAVMGVLAVMAWRSLHSHEVVRTALNTTRDRVAANERELRTLVQSVHEWIFRTDAAGRITFVNDRWQQISGRSDAAALGRCLAELCLAGDAQSAEALFQPGRTGGADTTMVRLSTAGGDIRTLEVSVAAVIEADGSTAGFAGFAVDVSERQLARRNLESQLAFTARLLDVSPTPLFVKDVAGRFITVNRAWLDLMGLELAQVVGRDSYDLFGGDADFHNEHDQRLLQSEERIHYENHLQRPGREGRDTRVTKVRFTQADGTPAGIVGSIIDVTEYRENERRIREARDAAEVANSAKSEFIANISHELRTPLQGIIGFSELGADLADQAPEFRDMFADILVGGRRMLTLVNGLLDVSQMDSAMGSLALQRCKLLPLLREAVDTLEPRLARRGQRVALHGLREPLEVDVDPLRFQQVLQNVLGNAARFAPDDSTIDIDCVDRGPAGVDIGVRDRGPGIPELEVEAIFEAFVQSSRTRDGSGGTGLGLTISRKIMSALGGSIEASNAAQGGAVIRIHLPAARPAVDELAPARPMPIEVMGH